MTWIKPKIDWEPSDIITDESLNRIEKNINYIEKSDRYPNQSATMTNSGTLSQILDFFATMIKEITGKADWHAAPRTSLENSVKRDGDTMAGKLIAQSNTDYAVRQVRNIIISPSDPDPNAGQLGDIWIKYTP